MFAIHICQNSGDCPHSVVKSGLYTNFSIKFCQIKAVRKGSNVSEYLSLSRERYKNFPFFYY